VGFLAGSSDLRPGRTAAEDGYGPLEVRIDREIADLLVAARAAGTSPVTVHLPIAADAVAWAAHRLRAVRPAMLHGDGRGAGVTLLLTSRVRSASLPALEDGIRQARRDGFGIAVPAAGFAPAEIARLAPDQLVLGAEWLAGIGSGEVAALATLEAATVLAGATRAELVVDGVDGEASLRDLRGRGAVVASGPVLAADQASARPAEVTLAPGLRTRLATTAPQLAVPPPDASDPGPVHPAREVTLGDVARPATVVPDTATGDDVRSALADEQDCAGVVLVGTDGRPTGYVDRNRFLLTIAGPYGRAVFAHRAAARLAESPTVRAATTCVRDAVRERLDGDPARRYDDVVLSEPDGRTVRVARFADLVRALDPAAGPAPVEVVGAPAGPAAPGTAPRRGRHRLVGLSPRPAGVAVG
jgi:hypothetical protein